MQYCQWAAISVSHRIYLNVRQSQLHSAHFLGRHMRDVLNFVRVTKRQLPPIFSDLLGTDFCLMCVDSLGLRV